jgi:hypothetical protein
MLQKTQNMYESFKNYRLKKQSTNLELITTLYSKLH